eukprot:m.114717 g.114717  ORF g.114717 m.114717 type:complete len:491 (+) comp10854_c0_seq2:327-1799(+)
MDAAIAEVEGTDVAHGDPSHMESAMFSVSQDADDGDELDISLSSPIPPPSDDADMEAAVGAAVKAVADDPENASSHAAVDPSGPEWRAHDKHVFIFSIAGKPIYSRWGDEDKLASLFGVMQALVSFVQEDDDELQMIKAGDFRITFQVRGPIVLVMAARTGESQAQMMMQLNYVYNQVIFILTYSQLKRIFEQQINYDLRRMLTGTEKFIDNLTEFMDRNPSFFLGAVRCLPLTPGVREKIGQVLLNCRIKDLVFGILIADNQLISLLRPRRYSLHPEDLHLIFNLVSCSSVFATGECYMPMCLPKFNNTGFLHAHVSYIDEACTTCLLLITNNRDAFFELKNCRSKIVQSLSSNGCLGEISKAVRNNSYCIDTMEVADLRHFLYKSKNIAQFTSPTLEAPYNLPGERERLFRRYQAVHHRIHSSSRPLKIYFHNGQRETMLGWITVGFELYACFGPLVTKPAAINAVLRLIRWMKREEDGLFIQSSLVF